MATGRLLDELMSRSALADFEINVFGEEPHGRYNRILLGRILGGGTQDEITIKPTAWYAEHDVHLSQHAGRDARRRPQRVETDDGEATRYDVAVFATGSRPLVPPLDGLTRDDGKLEAGIFVYRTIDDCSGSASTPGRRQCGRARRRTARARSRQVALRSRPARHRRARRETLMDAQLDRSAASCSSRQIERCGIYRPHRTVGHLLRRNGDNAVRGVSSMTAVSFRPTSWCWPAASGPASTLARASGR